ncbi:MAG: acetyl-CoA carboxylase biotin carboxyl carrier protein [Planctomycetota bacterium]
MDHQELRRLVRLMNKNGLVEVELEQEGWRVHLRKAEAPSAPLVTYAQPGYAQLGHAHPGFVPPPAAAPTPGGSPGEAADAPAGPPPGTKDIPSPMVGTFYRRPSPDAEPYVEVGDRVSAQTVVCIVEAMKVNNEIQAELSGEIVEVLAEDGQPVEYGEPLFRVKVA